MIMYTEKELSDVASRFDMGTEAAGIKPLGPGFINDTLMVTAKPAADGTVRRFILQRKNHIVFPDVPGMMQNIALVTEHIAAKVAAEGGDPLREVLTLTKRKPETMTPEEKAAPGGDLYYKDDKGKLLGHVPVHRGFRDL